MTTSESLTVDEIVGKLNEYEETHDTATVTGPGVHNIWQDVILTLPGYDEDASTACDTGQNDRFVTRAEGECGTHLVRYDPQAGRWFDSMTRR